MTAAVERHAPAKVNLSLRVVGRRDDGYHRLDSLVAFARLGDGVRVRPADGLSLAVTGPRADALAGLPAADNLVLRAAEALRARFGVAAGAAIELEKHLPAAGGLGGGSADAAAALSALCALWDLSPDEAALDAVALALGADVPVCRRGRPARMQGIGERLSPLPPLPDDPPAGLLLVNPGVEVPTGDVFRALAGRFSEPYDPPPALGPTARALAEALAPLGNDLTRAAAAVTPAVGAVLAALEGLAGCRYAAMSGSGATCFGLFDDAAAAEAAAATLAEARPDWWVAPSVLVP